MKITHLTILFSLFTLTIAPLAIADSEIINNDEVTNNLKERLKEVVQDTKINQVTESQLYGYIGNVTDIIQNTIILQDKEGKKSVKISDNSTILRSPGSKEIDLTNISIDDSIIAMGHKSDDDEIAGNRIIVSTTALTPPEKISGIATITSINKYSFSLAILDQDEPFELFFTKKTIYKSPTDILKLNDLTLNDEILYTATRDSDDDWSATIVMQIKTTDTPTSDTE